MKYFKYLIAVLLLLASIQPAQAFDSKSIVKIDTSYATFYRGTFDNLVLDFSIVTAKPDTLKAVSLKNLGTAENISQIKNVVLWADSGPVGFQGLGVDHQLANMNYFGTLKNWYADKLDLRIYDSRRFFVSVEFFTYFMENLGTIQFQIPQLVDSNDNGSFDLADQGIFMDSGDNGPVDFVLTNANVQVLSTLTTDTWKPKINLSNLIDNQIINNTRYTISGIAKDQGNSDISDLKIIIDNQEFSMTRTLINDWEYDWLNIADGTHTVKVTAVDQFGNFGQSNEVTVNVANQPLSLTNSEVTIDRTIIKNDGLDKATVTVKLKDIKKQLIANRQVFLESLDITAPRYQVTDQNGEAIFSVRSSILGAKILTIKTDDQILTTLNLAVNLPGVDINSGDLIKASTPALYYFGANGRRYVFPTEDIYFSWYRDFKNVKTLTESQLASILIGGNVTYKPGLKLIKITTDPKVYTVDRGGTLRWLKSEAVAQGIYGSNWASKIVDVSDVFFSDYKMGADIEKVEDFDLAKVIAISGINEDKNL